MKAVFADTFYFCALLNRADAAHAQAVAFSRQNTRPLVSTALVLAELANAFSDTPIRRQTAEFIRMLEKSPHFRAAPLDRDLWEAGLRLYENREDKGWSLTDCCSFVVMHRQNLTVALTGDRDFVQAGYEAVFR